MLILGRWLGETVDLETEGRVRARITVLDSDPSRGHVVLRIEYFDVGDAERVATIQPLGAGTSLVIYRGGRRLAEVLADEVGHRHPQHLRLLFDAPPEVRIFRPEYREKLARAYRLQTAAERPIRPGGPLSAFRATTAGRHAVA